MCRALFFALLLAGCSGQNDNEPGVGGVTAGEARQLNEAAAKLDSGKYDPAPTSSTSSVKR